MLLGETKFSIDSREYNFVLGNTAISVQGEMIYQGLEIMSELKLNIVKIK